ncbi:hypothetical protein D6D26_01470 [Aureobasidium pullulans]|nr:hypothetical protein D6D26_01470 [Aureobasidium pullulans]
MSLFTLLLLASCAFAQSFVPAFESSTSSNSCVKRSVIVYTSDSSTYFVTDIGTSSFPSTPTFCANASVSTVTSTVSGPAQTVVATQSASTVTVYQQATSALQSAGTQPSVDPILTNNSFENGTSSPFNSSTSTSSVWAEVVQAGVYQPRTGDSYLLITFDNAAAAQRQIRRQSTAPLVYNVTQIFAASAGTSYTLTAWAAVVITGNDKPDCSMTICGNNYCSSPFPLTTSYIGFSYNYQSLVDESDAVATFQVQCASSAYVALDDISVTNNLLAASASSAQAIPTATTTVFRTETVVQSQILTQIETTTFISGSEVVLTTTVPTVIYMTATVNNPVTETRTVSTLLISTATATIAVPEYVNITVSSVSTTTTTLTTILNSTVISYQPSLVIQTEYATSTALFTTTQPGLTLPASTVYQDPSTAFVTMDPSTVIITLEQPVVTITPHPVTLTSIADAQTSMVISFLNVTETLPRETAYVTPSPVTEYVTLTLEPNTTTIYISVTPPPLTETLNISVTLPAETQTQIQSVTLPQETETLQITQTLPQATEVQTLTLPPGTETIQLTQTLPPGTETLQVTQTLPPGTETLQITQTLLPETETLQITQTLPPGTETQQITQTLSPVTETLQITQTLPEVTQTLPQITETLPITQTLEITQYGPTITETYSSTSIPDFSTTSVDEPSSSSKPAVTLVEEPTSTVEEPSYSSVYVPPPPSGVPAVALARPTAVVGDVNGSPVSVDDVAYSVVLPVNLTMYGQSSANIRVSSNSLLGLTDLNWEYSNRPLPYQGNNYPGCLSETTTDEYGNTVNYCFGDAVAFGLWDDLFIYQGTQQGIYYEVDGAAPNRRTSFEFYISHFSDQSQYYHFLMNFYENKPNVINYQYLNVSDHGVSATVGVQSFSAQEFMQFSFNQAVICPGMQLTFNTTLGAGSYTIDDPGDCSIATTPPGSNNGEIARVGRMLKTRPEYRGDTAGYPSKEY